MTRDCPATGRPCLLAHLPDCAGPDDGTCATTPTPRLLSRSLARSSIRHGWPAGQRPDAPARRAAVARLRRAAKPRRPLGAPPGG